MHLHIAPTNHIRMEQQFIQDFDPGDFNWLKPAGVSEFMISACYSKPHNDFSEISID